MGARHVAHKKNRRLGFVSVLVLSVVTVCGALYLMGMRSVPTVEVLDNAGHSLAGPSAQSTAPATETTDTSGSQEVTTTTSHSTTKPTVMPTASSTLLAEGERADDSYLEDFLFIGDSRINGMRNRGQIADKNAFAVNGLSHSVALKQACISYGGKKMTVAQAVAARKPAIMLVAFGINGAAYMNRSGFMEDYAELIDKLLAASPDSTLIIQSILPVSAAYVEKDPRLSNDNIDWYNEQLYALAEEKGVYYLNTAEALKDSHNNLDAAYDSGDGLHFNTRAGEAILEYILTHPIIN